MADEDDEEKKIGKKYVPTHHCGHSAGIYIFLEVVSWKSMPNDIFTLAKFYLGVQ